MEQSDLPTSFEVSDFSGGMRRNVSAMLIGDNEYPLLVNMRSRYGTLRPVKLPLQISDGLPEGNFQGCYGSGSLVANFVSGETFIRDFSQPNSAFVRYEDTTLDPDVPIIYAVALPSSYINYARKPINLGTGATEKVEFTNPVTGSPSGILAQDGKNQPELLFTNGTRSRKTQTFEQWSIAEGGLREYVPIGKQMTFHDGVLYIVSPDGQEIYRSVTGRPLDFVIAVDVNGNKLDDNAFTVEASRWSHRVSFDPITYIGPLNELPQNPLIGIPFMVSTANGSWKVTPSFASTIYSEPKLLNTTMFPSGPTNQFSFVFTEGDGTFIDTTGVRLFSTLQANSNVSKDTALSGLIYKYFENVLQDTTFSACVFQDNYAIYALQTVFGPAFLFWDNLRRRFDALDIYSNVTSKVKMFCQTEINKLRETYFITEDNKFYKLFGSNQTAEWRILTKKYSLPEVEAEMKLCRVSVSFENVFESGDIAVSDYIDGRFGKTLTSPVTANTEDVSLPLALPLGDSTEQEGDKIAVEFQNSRRGDAVQVEVRGSIDVELDAIKISVEPELVEVGKTQKARIYEGTI